MFIKARKKYFGEFKLHSMLFRPSYFLYLKVNQHIYYNERQKL